MKVGITGFGCVTPLGADPAALWSALLAGISVIPEEVTNPESHRRYLAAKVPAVLTAQLAREPRLRRASAISSLAAAAGKAALADCGIEFSAAACGRFAIVFGVSSGGVQYTRRFYEQVVKQGANAASPMLFPETVYNAPASHLAAMLGVDGATYTLVGDGTVGLQAANFGAQLIALGDVDHVLVVAAEELDWILLAAHRDWRLIADGKNPGALLAEGAAALLLTRDEAAGTLIVPAGRSFLTQAEAGDAIESALLDLPRGAVDLVVNGGNGTWADAPLEAALAKYFPGEKPPCVEPKKQLGEALGAGSLLQVVLAAAGLKALQRSRALIAAVGWNQQAAAAVLEWNGPTRLGAAQA